MGRVGGARRGVWRCFLGPESKADRCVSEGRWQGEDAPPLWSGGDVRFIDCRGQAKCHRTVDAHLERLQAPILGV